MRFGNEKRDLIRALIWDMGGVLLRTEDSTTRQQLAQQLGVALPDLYAGVFNVQTARQATTGEIDAEQHWASVAEKYQLDAEGMAQFVELFWGGDRLDNELIAYIDAMRPVCKTVLLSNAWSDVRQTVDRRFHLVEHFDHVFFSAEIKLAKPAHAIYRYVLDEIKIPAQEAVFIDDMPENVEAARLVGLHAIQFHSREQVLDALAHLPIAAPEEPYAD